VLQDEWYQYKLLVIKNEARTHSVVERTDRAGPDDGVGERVQPGRVCVLHLGLLQLGEQRLLLGELLEDTSEVLALL
jgi:hypothetical protein